VTRGARNVCHAGNIAPRLKPFIVIILGRCNPRGEISTAKYLNWQSERNRISIIPGAGKAIGSIGFRWPSRIILYTASEIVSFRGRREHRAIPVSEISERGAEFRRGASRRQRAARNRSFRRFVCFPAISRHPMDSSIGSRTRGTIARIGRRGERERRRK